MTTGNPTLDHLDSTTVGLIVHHLDDESLASLSRTCRTLARLSLRIAQSRNTALIPSLVPPSIAFAQPEVTRRVPTAASPASSSGSGAASPSSAHADHDSLASTDTEMTPPPEEAEWVFQLTPALTHRLALLPQHEHGATLPSLPVELQLQIFSYLDKIDSCCLGLTSRNSYVIYRAIHGTKMPLNTRRIGPNKLEAAWEFLGKHECKHCGMYRCELHEHIKSWMPKELEYCAMKVNFGLPAPKNASHEHCFRGKPSKPKRCGRHPLRTTSVHQDDPHFALTKVQ